MSGATSIGVARNTTRHNATTSRAPISSLDRHPGERRDPAPAFPEAEELDSGLTSSAVKNRRNDDFWDSPPLQSALSNRIQATMFFL
jgi:hypothetical protein